MQKDADIWHRQNWGGRGTCVYLRTKIQISVIILTKKPLKSSPRLELRSAVLKKFEQRMQVSYDTSFMIKSM